MTHLGWKADIKRFIVCRMKQDPEYLRNQSRRIHAQYRRNRALSNILTSIWVVVFGALFCGSVLDWALSARWGLAGQMRAFAGFVFFGSAVWCFQTAVAKVILAYARHTYGPEPTD